MFEEICVKYDIATPPQGLWRKIANGRNIATPALKSGQAAQVIDIVVADPKRSCPGASSPAATPCA